MDLEKLSEPLTKLVEVVATGIGTLYAPYGTVKQATADAKSRVIIAKADVVVASIEQRANSRLMYRESLRQENIEAITSISASELPDKVSDKPVDVDWTIQYLDHAQDVFDKQLQTLWARILAGEVTSPGSYSKRTLAFLKSLDKWEAVAFTQFCSFALEWDNGWRFLLHEKAYTEMLNERFENKDYESHFISIGLLQSETSMFPPSGLDNVTFGYFGTEYVFKQIEKIKKTSGVSISQIEIPLSTRNFSMIGQQLAKIAEPDPIDNYIEKLGESTPTDSNVRIEPKAL
jgi:hypothetical protein